MVEQAANKALITERKISGFLPYKEMRIVSYQEYLEFLEEKKEVIIGGKKINVTPVETKELIPNDFTLETTTVWSFPKRGSWASHKYNSKYRGNWAPQIPRNLMLLYTKKGDVVLDPFMGSGTTVIECKLLKRKCIGIDINYDAIMLAWSRLSFDLPGGYPPQLYVGDARNLNLIEDESIDFIATHPPYAGMIKYAKRNGVEGDLSHLGSIKEYLEEFRIVVREFMRILKPNAHLAIMIGDMRRRKHIIPLGIRVLETLLDEGFILREHIIKIQHNMTGTRKWIGKNKGFLLIKHEHIFVLRKPSDLGEQDKYKESVKWW